jgi:hypothetical protein
MPSEDGELPLRDSTLNSARQSSAASAHRAHAGHIDRKYLAAMPIWMLIVGTESRILMFTLATYIFY